MLSLLAPFLLLSADTASDQRFGAWQAAGGCVHGTDNFGCSRTLSQSNPEVEVVLIFRDGFSMRAGVRGCDRTIIRHGFTPDPAEWKALSIKARMDRVRQVLAQWTNAAGTRCDRSAALSFDGFEDGFSRQDAMSRADNAPSPRP